MQGRGTTLTTPLWEVTSGYGGCVISAPKATSTVGQLEPAIELRHMQLAALFALAGDHVIATPCNPFTLKMQLTLIAKQMG